MDRRSSTRRASWKRAISPCAIPAETSRASPAAGRCRAISTAMPIGRRTSRRDATRGWSRSGSTPSTTISLACTDPDFGLGADPPTPTPLGSDALKIVMGPSHGTIGGLSDGKVVYTPNNDFQGTDAFTYTGTDGTSKALPASVTIQVGQQSSAARPDAAVDLGNQHLGQEMASRQRPGEDLEGAGRDHDLLRPQRGGAGDAHLPATGTRAPSRAGTASSRRAATRATRDAPATSTPAASTPTPGPARTRCDSRVF